MKNYQKGSMVLWVTILVVVILGACGYLYIKNNFVETKQTAADTTTQTNTDQSNRSGWKTYTNEKYGFTFMYPPTATASEGGSNGGGIPNPGQVNFSVGFPNHPTDGPGGIEVLRFSVQPATNPPYATTDGLYQIYKKTLGSQGYSVEKFTLGKDAGVLYFLLATDTQTKNDYCASANVDVLHGAYNFTMPSLFGTIFAPQTNIGDCVKITNRINNDYVETLSSFKFINQTNETSVVKENTPSYDLMMSILSKLGVININITNSILEWNTNKTKVNYSGYSTVINHTAAENLQITQTWNNTGSLDKLDIRSRFVNELKTRGFVDDRFNSGDGTFVGSSGYVNGNIICLIKDKVTTTPEQISDTSGFSSINTIICADTK